MITEPTGSVSRWRHGLSLAMGGAGSRRSPDDAERQRVEDSYRGSKEMMEVMVGRRAAVGTTGSRAAWRMRWSSSFDVKPEAGDPPTTNTLSPLWCCHLSPSTTHVGRRLTGKIIRGGVHTGGVYFVLEDAVGGVVKVGVYNIPDAGPRVAAELFPEGFTVTVIEPYYKIGQDQLPFIRVDNPAELDMSLSLPGSDPLAWQREGKDSFA